MLADLRDRVLTAGGGTMGSESGQLAPRRLRAGTHRSRGAVNTKMLLAGVGVVVGVGVLIWALASSSLFARDPMVDAARLRPAVDAETGTAYREFRMPVDDSPPWKSPGTGQETVWPAELCYWTREGKATMTPTLVILNEYLGKAGPTSCPDCGRPVVRHNPMPPVELMVEAAGGS